MGVEGIPGSSPDWKHANMKARGKAAVGAVPASHLAGGLAAWATCCDHDVQSGASRRHFHHLPQAQTRAYDCSPCVDGAEKQNATTGSTCGSSSSQASGSTATSTAASGSGQQWRRHRRQVPAPPCNPRHEGKRMLPLRAASVSCKDLLQDPDPCQHTPPSPAAAAAAAACRDRLQLLKMDELLASMPSGKQAASSSAVGTQLAAVASQSLPAAAPPPPSLAGTLSSTSSSKHFGNMSPSLVAPAATQDAEPLGAGAIQQQQQQCLTRNADSTSAGTSNSSSKSGSSKGKRVEDDPSYFRTPKDPPTLQRFVASLKPLQGGRDGSVQRHAAGIRARQQAQVAAEAQAVMALERFGRADQQDA